MTAKKITTILKILDAEYPWDDSCFLEFEYEKPWQLLFATILSAQCTDNQVNFVTRTLFKKYADIGSFAAADIGELENDIRATGFFHMKAKHIKQCAEMLLTDFGGEVPSDIAELTSLPGVGRKTANVVRGHVFKIPSIVVDTHVKRVSRRLGLTENEDPEKIEYDLMKALPKSHWIRFNQQIIAHGRKICRARSPRCEECALAAECANRLL
jgi:endonuclease-3